jgi:4-amino-4-deoxy-L-arabinose transferase-like glycosyltransferase
MPRTSRYSGYRRHKNCEGKTVVTHGDQGHLRRTFATAIGATAIAALLFTVLFWRLGEATFWDPDEAHYAESTRELITSGDWWSASYNNQPFFDKPILFHQLQAIAMLVCGQNELGARAVPALAALALVAITAWLGASLISREVGLLGALLVAINPGLFALARYAILDTVFTAFLFGGVSLVAVAAVRNRPALQYSGYLLIALATLTKGPLAIALCGLTMLLAIAASATLRQRLLRLRWMAGLAIVIAVASPWFVYMYLRFGEGFVNGYLLDENLRLFATNRFGSQPGPTFYFQIVAVNLLPWTAILIGRLVDDVRAALARRPIDDIELLLWAWTVAVVGFFTPSRFKLDHYVFPAAPALALLVARAWADVRANPDAREHRAARVGVMLAGPLLVIMGLAVGYLLLVRLDLPRVALVAPAVMIAAGAEMIARFGRRGSRQARIPVFAFGAIVLTYAVAIALVIPRLEARKVMPELGRWIDSQAAPADRVGSYRLNSAFRFYVNRHVTVLDGPEEALRYFEREEPFFCVMPESVYQSLASRGAKIEAVYWRDGTSATSIRTLWRGQTKGTRFVVVTRAGEGRQAATAGKGI